MEKVFKISFRAIWNKGLKAGEEADAFSINESRMIIYLKAILEREVELVYRYKNTMFHNSDSPELHCYEVLHSLLRDYAEKKGDFDTESLDRVASKDRDMKWNANQIQESSQHG